MSTTIPKTKSLPMDDNFFKKIDAELSKTEEKADYEFFSLEQINKIEFPKEQWIVDRLIPKAGITCIAGLPASMKSYFTNYIASCISEQKPILDKFKSEKTNILFIDKENKLSRIKDRFTRLGSTFPDNVYFLSSNFLLENDNDLGAVVSFIKDHKIGLTIIDTLVRVHQLEENSASEMNKVYQALHELQIAGSSVLFIHHFNKRGSGFGSTTDVRELLRGSGDILAMVDNYIALKYVAPFIEVEQGKSRDDDLVPKFLMQVNFEQDKTYFDYVREINEEDRIININAEDQIRSLLLKGTSTRKWMLKNFEGELSRPMIDRALKSLKASGEIKTITNSSNEYIYMLSRDTLIQDEIL